MRHILVLAALTALLLAPATARALPFYLLLEGMTDQGVYDGEVESSSGGAAEEVDVAGGRGSLYFKTPIPLIPRLDPGVVVQYRSLESDLGDDFEAVELAYGGGLRWVPINVVDLFQPYLLAEVLVEFGDYEYGSRSEQSEEVVAQIGAGAMSEIPGGLMLTAGVLYRPFEPDRPLGFDDLEFDTKLHLVGGVGWKF